MQTQTIDFLIAGSGAGGMTAALKAHRLGMNVLIIEKAPFYGGSTAMSGGGIWVPNNYILKENHIVNTEEEVVKYLQAVTQGEIPEAKLRMYARKGPEMFGFLKDLSPAMQFTWSKGYSDYHPEFLFGRKEGRSVEAEPFNLKELGEDRKFLQPADIDIPGGIWLTASDFNKISMVMRNFEGKKRAFKILMRMLWGRIIGKKTVALGQSLAGRLRLVLKQKNIPLWLNSPLRELIITEGRVAGAIIEKDGVPMKILASKGVLIATGGFDHNMAMRKAYLPEIAQQDYSAGSRQNMGDGILIGEHAGAKLDLMDDAWWMPSVKLPNGNMFTLVSERAIPRSIIVGENGRRFTNEAAPYVNFVHDQIEKQQKNIYQILDQTAVNRYMYAGKPPLLPFPEAWYDSGIIFKAESLEALALKAGIDKDNFVKEVERFNIFAEAGRDEDFLRGESTYDSYYGDPTLKNPVLDRINKAPFYAIKIVIGDIGTKGGLLINEFAQVLDKSNHIIPGLFAAGNASASVMGNDYAGAGATIGPAMVFGYIAAETANVNV